MSQIDIENFNYLLAETIAWCGSHASLLNPKQSLRAMLPNAATDISRMNKDELRQVADNIFQERARLLKTANIEVSKGNLAGGRLLICYPEESVWDGAAEAASQEFFDVADIPACDTWCYYSFEEKLEPTFFIVSWVPPSFIELAQSGIDVNPVESIQWASKLDNLFTCILSTERLLL